MGIRIAALIVIGCCSLQALAQPAPADSVLPASLPGWRLAEPPRTLVGEALFELIDGGAVLYQEYGFDHVVTGEYIADDAGEIDAEVYAMSDAGGARGIFAVTAATGEQELSLGDEGALGEYFLVFRKGRRVVTVSGQSADGRTMEAVRTIGRAIEARIGSGNETISAGKPVPADGAVAFIDSFRTVVGPGTRPVYVRGPVAVGNFYLFGPQNIFSVREGIAGERDSTRFFAFLYRDTEESGRVLKDAVQSLRANEKYSGVRSSTVSFTAMDRDGNLLRGVSTGSAIVMVIGRKEALMRSLEADIAKIVRGIDIPSGQPPLTPPGAR